MDERAIMVNMAQLAVSGNPGDVLTALGLGSCVAVCAYDPSARLGGMIHVVLPSSAIARPRDGPAKFADLGVPRLVAEMEQEGAARWRLRVALLGGANVLSCGNDKAALDIGSRNVAAVREALAAAGLPISAQEGGGAYSRTVRLCVATAEVIVKTLRGGEATVAVLRGEDGGPSDPRASR